MGNLLIAQEPQKADGDQPEHPAVKTLIAWAESHQKDSEEENVEIFSSDDKKRIEAFGKQGEVEDEMRAFVLSKKDRLSFKPGPGNSPAGMIFIENRRFFPMKLKGEKWMGDLIAMMEGIKASATIGLAEQSMASFKTILEMYKNLGGHYPSEQQGLAALIKKPSTSPRPRRWVQALQNDQALIDPWGNAYQYKLVDGQPIITSLGPDGKVSQDDISSQ